MTRWAFAAVVMTAAVALAQGEEPAHDEHGAKPVGESALPGVTGEAIPAPEGAVHPEHPAAETTHGEGAEHGEAAGEHAAGEHAAGAHHAANWHECVEHEAVDVPGYIIHHVSDDCAYEFEMPGPLYSGHNPRWDLNKTFGFLVFQTKEGACDAHAEATNSFGALFDGCIDLRPTKQTIMMWLAGLLLIIALLAGSNRDKNKLVPRGAGQNLFEMLVLFVRDEIAIKNIGKEEGPRYVPYLLSAFFFILFMNLLGLIPWMATATGNLAITCGLALITFFLTQLASIRAAGIGGYLKHLTGGVPVWLWPIMVPVEVLGLFTKPFALTVRLFANMLAGHIVIFFLLALIFLMNIGLAFVSVPMAAGIYFLELFVAFVQAYIFAMLSALFIGMGVAMGHHAEHDEHDHGKKHMEGSHAHDHGKASFV